MKQRYGSKTLSGKIISVSYFDSPPYVLEYDDDHNDIMRIAYERKKKTLVRIIDVFRKNHKCLFYVT